MNPLAYLHDFDPLVLRDRYLFGPTPKPLPAGSAVLAPGQKLVQPPSAATPAPGSGAAPAASKGKERAHEPTPPPQPRWQDLLARAVDAFLDSPDAQNPNQHRPSGSPIDAASVFTAEAFKVASAAAGKKRARGGNSAATQRSGTTTSTSGDETGSEAEMQPNGEGELKPSLNGFALGAAGGAGAGGSGAPVGGKGKKKRKRPKRVGH